VVEVEGEEDGEGGGQEVRLEGHVGGVALSWRGRRLCSRMVLRRGWPL
jgi:hypothetical protein